jgi:chromosome segregation and condensation protein ScpB
LPRVTLAELAEAAGVPIPHVRPALRRLAEQLEPTGIQVLDDGSQVQLAPDRRFHAAVGRLVQPEQLPRLTQEQAEVLAIVISDGMATRRRIEEVRGRPCCRWGRTGPSRCPDLLCAETDDHSMGRPLVYRPTLRLLQLLGAETAEEVRGRLGVPEDNVPNSS